MISLWQEDEGCYRPNTKHKPDSGPQVFRIPIITSEQATDDGIEDMNDEGSPSKNGQGKCLIQYPQSGEIS
jgi:hypothetical protein